MATAATTSIGVQAARGAAANDPPAPLPVAVQFASAWLDAAVIWQTAMWAANLETMRLAQQALRPGTWTDMAEQWAYLLRNGPIPA